jgi:DNA-binding FadR family transcriptional regulator
MPPGGRIGEQELADEFAVSRGPIRDALRILEREGLATLLPRRGAIVTELSADELRELLEIRAGLFEMVVRKIAATAQPQELLAMLEAGVARLETLATPAARRQRLRRDDLPPADPVRAPVRQPAAAAHADRAVVADAALQQAGPGLGAAPPAVGAPVA